MQTAFSGITNMEHLLPAVHPGQQAVSKTSGLKSSDEISIGILTPEKTQALLNREIADKLEQRFKEEGIELSGLQAEDFTPEKVSERILGFVSGRILSEQDNEQQAQLMEQARKGIEQGFSEAREILESLDVLNGRIKEDVDSTYELIQQGLERLQQQLDGTPVDDDEDENAENELQEGIAQVQQATMQSSFSRNENTQVEITTRDGDTILIDLFKQQSGQSSRSFALNDDGFSFSESRNLSASTGISYQLEGELDEDEQKAIDDLLKDVAGVSDSFFSGNVQKAFNNAMKMDFDSEELTRFSLNMNYQESRQVAISTYSEYQSQSESEDDEHPMAQTALRDMSEFVKQMDHLMQNPFAINKFSDPEQGVADLLKGMNQILHSDAMQKLQNDSAALLDSLVQQLKQFHHDEPEDSQSDITETIT
ncbi:MAG: DUF5610 domain-containing protein [Gammaproteobacteria bacterium]|nr:DUF5610 domain-containing protein [Gammaproteobacteria bacterium]